MLIRATYSVVTPLFSSGAIQERAELRLPAFKGVLRFWWRALAWSRFHGDLQRIHQEESNTFGSPSGQSAVWMRLKHTGPLRVLRQGEFLLPRVNFSKYAGSRSGQGWDGAYYLGYGLTRPAGRDAGSLLRPALLPPLQFSIEMLVNEDKMSDVAWPIISGGSYEGYGFTLTQSRARSGGVE